jgi:hypothetical protein
MSGNVEDSLATLGYAMLFGLGKDFFLGDFKVLTHFGHDCVERLSPIHL